MMFDIKDVCHYITQDLLKKVLNFANEYIIILKCDVHAIHTQIKYYCLTVPISGLRSKEVGLI